MNSRTQGLDLTKYKVERADGSTRAGGKHSSCSYFVLDLEHDKYAAQALVAYSAACKEEYPVLSEELHHVATLIKMKRSSSYGKTKGYPPPACKECQDTGLRECHEEARGHGGFGGVTECECGAGHRRAL